MQWQPKGPVCDGVHDDLRLGDTRHRNDCPIRPEHVQGKQRGQQLRGAVRFHMQESHTQLHWKPLRSIRGDRPGNHRDWHRMHKEFNPRNKQPVLREELLLRAVGSPSVLLPAPVQYHRDSILRQTLDTVQHCNADRPISTIRITVCHSLHNFSILCLNIN